MTGHVDGHYGKPIGHLRSEGRALVFQAGASGRAKSGDHGIAGDAITMQSGPQVSVHRFPRNLGFAASNRIEDGNVFLMRPRNGIGRQQHLRKGALE